MNGVGPEDVELTDAEFVERLLPDPNALAMHEALGRWFRDQPPDYQIAALELYLAQARDQVTGIEARITELRKLGPDQQAPQTG